jgi:hypothetical protein
LLTSLLICRAPSTAAITAGTAMTAASRQRIRGPLSAGREPDEPLAAPASAARPAGEPSRLKVAATS